MARFMIANCTLFVGALSAIASADQRQKRAVSQTFIIIIFASVNNNTCNNNNYYYYNYMCCQCKNIIFDIRQIRLLIKWLKNRKFWA